MRRPALVVGAVLGGVTSLVMLALFYLGSQLAALPFVPFDLFDWLTRALPGNVVELGISTIVNVIARLHLGETSSTAKLIEQLLAGGQMVALGVLFGVLIAALQRGRLIAWKAGIDGGVVLFAVLALVEWNLRIAIAHAPVVALLWIAVLSTGWGVVLATLLQRLRSATPQHTMTTDRIARRTVLLQIAAGSIGLTVAATGLGRLLQSGSSSASGQVAGTATGSAGQQFAAAKHALEPVTGTRAELTPNDKFYRIDINAFPPKVNGATWQLEVAGLFDQLRPLTMADLQALPAWTQPVTESCISNLVGGDLIGTNYWTGVRLRDVLGRLGLQPTAKVLAIRGADGFYETVSREDMQDERTLLVYAMNGQPLAVEHGYPLRIYIPNRYGMKQPKWITRIEAVDHDSAGFWVERGWGKEARPQIVSVIDTATPQRTAENRVPLGGIAWAGDRGIQKVELQIDNGAWQPATLLSPPLGPLTWVLWRFEVQIPAGEHTFRVRATDGTGKLQTEQIAEVRPDGATGYHSITARV